MTEAAEATYELPMFPLGSTVFPAQVVPLHIFEERYRALLAHITSDGAEATFGIALIDRGHEVGGGDHRVSVGTRVEVLQAEEFDDGRWGAVVAGVERITILEWLEDAPYPRARVQTRVVRDNGGSSLDELRELFITTIGLMARQTGVDVPSEYDDLATDPRERLDQLSALSPLTDFDRQQVLEAATTADQITTLRMALTDKVTLLRAQLGEN